MEKLFFIDVETGGVDHRINALLQFSGIIEIDGEIVEEVNEWMQPFPGDTIEDEALEIIGKTREEIQGFQKPQEAYTKIIKLMDGHVDRYNRSDKFHFIGYNARFDEGFMRAFFQKNDDPYFGSWFFWPAIDITNIIAFRYLKTRAKFPSYKLMEVAKRLGMEIDESRAHDAQYDIEVTRELFHGMRNMLTGGGFYNE